MARSNQSSIDADIAPLRSQGNSHGIQNSLQEFPKLSLELCTCMYPEMDRNTSKRCVGRVRDIPQIDMASSKGAIESHRGNEQKRAKNEKLQSLDRNDAWDVLVKQKGKDGIHWKLFLKVKRNAGGRA